MTNLLSEIKFALENGFTDIERLVEKDGSIAFKGTFGYAVVTAEDAEAISELIAQYTTSNKDVKVLKIYSEHGNLKVGDTVSTGKRTKQIAAIRLVKHKDNEPVIWFTMKLKNGMTETVGLEATKKYKVVS